MRRAADAAGSGKQQRFFLLQVFNRIFTAGVAVFIIIFLVANAGRILGTLTRFRPALLVASLCLHLVFVLFQGFLANSVIRSTGSHLRFRDSLPIIFISVMGRYLPGKIWVLTSRTTMLSGLGASPESVVAGTIIEHVFVVVTGLAVGLPFFAGLFMGIRVEFLAGIILATLLGFTMLPQFLHSLTNRALGFFNRPPLASWPSAGKSLFLILAYSLNWIVLGTGVLVLARELLPGFRLSLLFSLTGIYALSVTAGFLALFAPGGLGVRDGLLAAGLSRYLPVVEAATLALAARFMISLAEFTVAGLSMVRLHGGRLRMARNSVSAPEDRLSSPDASEEKIHEPSL